MYTHTRVYMIVYAYIYTDIHIYIYRVVPAHANWHIETAG